jgi:hypothetical protein
MIYKITYIITLLTLVLGIMFGWIMNIINLIQGAYEPVSTIVIAAIGVLIPFVGALVYYIN